MQLEEQIAAVREYGYSTREAEFVVLAALHSGCFLRRQYTLCRGKSAASLCDRIRAYRHGSPQSFAHRTYVWHLSGKSLYRAIGQDDNKHRRTHEPTKPASYLRTKLMGFDYVLAHPQYEFLPTEDSKLEYFSRARNVPLFALPSRVYASPDGTLTTRWFLDKYPIRIAPATGQVAFCYIDAPGSMLPSFGSWLEQTTPLLRALGEAEVICVAGQFGSGFAFPNARKEFLAQFPDTPGAVPPDLLEYFTQRRVIDSTGIAGRSQADLDGYRLLHRRYAAAHFQQQYAAWLRGQSGAVSDTPRVTFSTCLLPHSYAMFGSVLGGEETA